MISKLYKARIEVRGHELDSFGHVNNSVYLNYLEYARWKMLKEEDVTLQKFQTWKRWPVIARVEIDYVKPTFMLDELEIRTCVIEHRQCSFTIRQEIFRNDDCVAKATLQSVVVDEFGKPARIPEELSRTWKRSS